MRTGPSFFVRRNPTVRRSTRRRARVGERRGRLERSSHHDPAGSAFALAHHLYTVALDTCISRATVAGGVPASQRSTSSCRPL